MKLTQHGRSAVKRSDPIFDRIRARNKRDRTPAKPASIQKHILIAKTKNQPVYLVKCCSWPESQLHRQGKNLTLVGRYPHSDATVIAKRVQTWLEPHRTGINRYRLSQNTLNTLRNALRYLRHKEVQLVRPATGTSEGNEKNGTRHSIQWQGSPTP